MKRVAYFGTQGSGEVGHYFIAIKGEFTYEEREEITRLDSYDTLNMFEGKRSFRFFRYGRYLGLAFPASPDDKRGGSITLVVVEKAETHKEVLDALKASEFVKSQFDRLSKIYDISIPQE